jgi:DNA primase small subunit
MNTESKFFLRKKFKEYYWNHSVAAPREVHRREFGVGTLDDKIKFRHKGFKSERELAQYLRTEAPYYISYSAAYYEFPQQPMAHKGWLGADLIFDLDKPMEFLSRARLSEVRDEALSLVGFLKDDFGFADADISVNFSGSKGYHIHVLSDDVKTLNSEARREIVDYVSGSGLDVGFFVRQGGGVDGIKYERGKVKAVGGDVVGPGAGSVGWAKRVYDVAQEVIMSPPEELQKIAGVGAKTAKKMAEANQLNLRLLRSGKWDVLWGQLRGSVQMQIISKAVRVTDDDKQVTADVSRLIRLPDTIHGGSGLLAKKVGDLASFDPLIGAVAFAGEPFALDIVADVPAFDLLDGSFGPFKAGDKASLPECVGVYLLLKGKAEVSVSRVP